MRKCCIRVSPRILTKDPCPQADAIFDLLSVGDHSDLYTFSNPFNLQPRTATYTLKGHSGAELHIYFLVHLESIYYEIFFYSKIVPNCAVAK